MKLPSLMKATLNYSVVDKGFPSPSAIEIKLNYLLGLSILCKVTVKYSKLSS